MRRLAAFARKAASGIARRLGASSGSGGAAGRAAPGERTISTEMQSKTPRSAVGRSAPGEARAPSEPRARRKIAPEPLPGAAGRKKEAQWRQAPLLPPTGRKAAEAMKKAPFFAEGLSVSTTTAPSTSMTTSRAPPPPQADSDFWYKMMMVGGSALGFLIHSLKGYVDKEVELKMKEKETQEKDKVIKEKDRELQLTKQELAIATENGKRRGWFGH